MMMDMSEGSSTQSPITINKVKLAPGVILLICAAMMRRLANMDITKLVKRAKLAAMGGMNSAKITNATLKSTSRNALVLESAVSLVHDSTPDSIVGVTVSSAVWSWMTAGVLMVMDSKAGLWAATETEEGLAAADMDTKTGSTEVMVRLVHISPLDVMAAVVLIV